MRIGRGLMYVTVGGVNYYYLAFIDEYSRYIVHWELLSNMEGDSVSVGGQKALETLPRNERGELLSKPEIRSDNGSGFISKEFHGVLAHYGLTHVRIRPHCPEENGIIERSNRTVRQALEEAEPSSRYEAAAALGRIIAWYNHQRLHSSLGYLRPVDYYRGDPQSLHEARRKKLAAARHRRREKNLDLRQPTLPIEGWPTCCQLPASKCLTSGETNQVLQRCLPGPRSPSRLTCFDWHRIMRTRRLNNKFGIVLKKDQSVNRLASALLVCAVAAFAITLVGAEDDTAKPKASKASKVAEAWWYPGDGVDRKDQSSQKTGAGPETGEFFAYTGTAVNLGDYRNAWDYYAAKCGAGEKHGDQPRIVGKPTKTGGYYTIFQRTDGGRHVTMFARHERDSTVTVYLHEVESTADKMTLQISIVVACH